MNENGFSRTLTLKNSIYLGLSSMIGAGLFNNIALTAKVSSYSAILGLLLASTLRLLMHHHLLNLPHFILKLEEHIYMQKIHSEMELQILQDLFLSLEKQLVV